MATMLHPLPGAGVLVVGCETVAYHGVGVQHTIDHPLIKVEKEGGREGRGGRGGGGGGFIYMCWAQSMDLRNPRIVLRKPWIRTSCTIHGSRVSKGTKYKFADNP